MAPYTTPSLIIVRAVTMWSNKSLKRLDHDTASGSLSMSVRLPVLGGLNPNLLRDLNVLCRRWGGALGLSEVCGAMLQARGVRCHAAGVRRRAAGAAPAAPALLAAVRLPTVSSFS